MKNPSFSFWSRLSEAPNPTCSWIISGQDDLQTVGVFLLPKIKDAATPPLWKESHVGLEPQAKPMNKRPHSVEQGEWILQVCCSSKKQLQSLHQMTMKLSSGSGLIGLINSSCSLIPLAIRPLTSHSSTEQKQPVKAPAVGGLNPGCNCSWARR